MGASSLIEHASKRGVGITVPSKAAAEVKKVAEYNLTAHRDRKIHVDDVLKMLQSEFGVVMSVNTFQRWHKRTFGKSFGAR